MEHNPVELDMDFTLPQKDPISPLEGYAQPITH